jgi:tRNA(Ile)-lysidine synthase TilS/MesJ
MFTFCDRLGKRTELETVPGESAEMVLLRNLIPPASVILLRDGIPVSESCVVSEQHSFEASLIEGYDIESIRSEYRRMAEQSGADDAPFVKRRLGFSVTGGLESEVAGLSLEELAEHVEETVVETCREFELIRRGDGVLVGLSGGVDSSALLLALANARSQLPKFRLAAVTFEDCDMATSPTFQHAIDLARELEVEHHIAPAQLAQDVFRLQLPLKDALGRVMRTQHGHHTMYLDHHTTRRVLEVFGQREGLNVVALGLHTTDLIGGLLNGWTTGYRMGAIPARDVNGIRYVYPLAFLSKRELHLYHWQRTGKLSRHTHPNAWELTPLDRNYYYYLADMLQTLWPGLETHLIPAHNWRVRREPPLQYESCRNCGAAVLHQPFTPVDAEECDACTIFREAGLLREAGD